MQFTWLRTPCIYLVTICKGENISFWKNMKEIAKSEDFNEKVLDHKGWAIMAKKEYGKPYK